MCTAGHGHAEPAVYYHQHVTHQQRPAVFADHSHSSGLHSSSEVSQSPVQGVLQPTASQTVNESLVPDYSESVPVSEAPSTSSEVSGATAEQSDVPLANMKEKTPMCLINELARFNKVCFLAFLTFIFSVLSIVAAGLLLRPA